MDGLQVELATDVPKDPDHIQMSLKKGISPNQSRDGIHPCKVLNRDLDRFSALGMTKQTCFQAYLTHDVMKP